MFRGVVTFLLALSVASLAGAQGQAINGTIEGTVTDESGGVLPGVVVTVTNVDTGDTRSVITNDSGVYRAPLLPLGAYRVTAELPGFKKHDQTGISLSAGQVAVVDVKLEVGAVTETVSVSADAPVVDAGRIEQGRTLTAAEIKTLPLTSRNPYNFALLQPGVVGFETQEFGVPRLTANGALLRVNYQIDGNDNTEKDRAGLRQMPMSEVMIREVKVVTTGYAPEFGQTMGLVYNAITPSGTNRLHGQASYRFQREPMVELPFFATTDVKPPTKVNIFTVDNGGPIVKDRTFYFGGFERTQRDLSGARVVTITPANAARLGLSEPTYIPAEAKTTFAIGKIDHNVSTNNRLNVRYIFFDNFIPNNIGSTSSGVPNSVQQGTDFSDRQHSTAGQLVSTIGSRVLNELRVQYATRTQARVPGSQAGSRTGNPHQRRGQFRRPGSRQRRFGVRVHRGDFSSPRQRDLHPRQPRLQVRLQHAGGERLAHADADPALHVRERRRVSGGAQRGQSVRLHLVPAVRRQSDLRVRHADVRGVRAGRLASHPDAEAPVRSALRHLHAAGGCRHRRARCLARVSHRQEQRAAAGRLRVGPRRGSPNRVCAATAA